MSLVGNTKKVKNEPNSRIVQSLRVLKKLLFLNGVGIKRRGKKKKAEKGVELKNCCGRIKLKYSLSIKYVLIHTFWRCGNV